MSAVCSICHQEGNGGLIVCREQSGSTTLADSEIANPIGVRIGPAEQIFKSCIQVLDIAISHPLKRLVVGIFFAVALTAKFHGKYIVAGFEKFLAIGPTRPAIGAEFQTKEYYTLAFGGTCFEIAPA